MFHEHVDCDWRRPWGLVLQVYKRVFHEHVDCDCVGQGVLGMFCTNACSMSTWIATQAGRGDVCRAYKRVFHEHVDCDVTALF